MLKKTACPLCGKRFTNILQHLAFTHEIQGSEELKVQIESLEKKKRRQAQFNEYVNTLKAQRAKGTISAEELRVGIMKWFDEHKQAQ